MSAHRIRKAFVTGATGFLGYEIARQLAAAGVEVRAATRGGALPGELGALGVRTVRASLDDPAALAEAMRGVDTVLHVAADVGMWRRRRAESVRVNVDGTRHVAEAALAAGVERAVFTSSGSTIGKPLDLPRRGDVPTVDESSAYNLAALDMVYPHTKWLGEEEVWKAVRAGLGAVVTHPCAIFGPSDWKHNLLPLFRAPRTLLGLAVPEGYRTTCDVRDVAAAHLRAAERGRPGERYILGGECVSVRELFGRIAAATGGRAPRFTLPAGLVVALGTALERLADATGKPPLLSREMAIQSTLRVRLSSAKAERELGYHSRPLEASLRDAVAWYRAQGLL
ncbi:MAG: NAD-dependent epimerase/dehydratase family protein [Polyangiaceae bacterium]|nr:NAD-dependent epimerase/dehydratase family protein [Polyangiaceae bacterium]